jgi:ABC-type nickel/cobalt efflux system permease component RcnA
MGRRRVVLATFGLLLTALVTVFSARPASAHPLGNFTVNRYARLEVSARVLRVYYVLDEAEIPAFQDRDAVRRDPNGFAARRAADVAHGLSLTVDGHAASLVVQSVALSQPLGQGGLHTLRLAVLYTTALDAGDAPRTATFADGNEPDRIGWREIVVTAPGDGRVLESDAPARDRTDELRAYPADLIQSPLNLRAASFRFTPGMHPIPASPLTRAEKAPARAGGRFAELVTRTHVGPWVLAGMLAVALFVGAAHALAPGHGKTVMAAYLVGTRGRVRDALLVGTIVSAMHTGSVLALGLVLFHVSRSTSLDRIYPALTFAGGLIVVGIGVWLLRSRLAALRHHSHDHDHGHDHGHADHDHPHSHALPPGVSPISRRGLVVLAGSGGIVPSPSAVIVLVSAFALGRVALGLALIAAFSVGLAATLTAVGLALVLARGALERRHDRWLARLPAAGATALIVAGAVVAAQAVPALH